MIYWDRKSMNLAVIFGGYLLSPFLKISMCFSPLSGMGPVPSFQFKWVKLNPSYNWEQGPSLRHMFLFLGIDQPIWVQNSREKPFRMQVHGIKLVMYQNGLSGKPP